MSRAKEKHHGREEIVKAPKETGHQLSQGEEVSPVSESIPMAPSPEAVSAAPATPPGDGKASAPAEAVPQAVTVEQLQDQLLRLRADFDNFRKRTLREKNEIYDHATYALMLALLPVLDHLQLGIQAARDHQADKAIQEGLQLIFDQLMGVLTKFGLSALDAEKQPFAPARFEAVSFLPSEKEPEGMILAQTRRGYMLRDKLLRPAQVVVSSGPPKTKAEATETADIDPPTDHPVASAEE